MKKNKKWDPKIEYRDPKSLVPYAKNAKIHTKDQIKKVAGAISKFGFTTPIVIDKDGVIIAGHCRREASIQLALPEVPVVVADHLSEDEVMAARIADNKVSEGSYNSELLRFELKTLEMKNFDMAFTGFELPELKSFLDTGEIASIRTSSEESEKVSPVEAVEKVVGKCDEDEIPEHVEPKTKLGDIYQLGNHRLMCGDSTDIESVEKLMDGKKVDMVFTDPPYNIDYSPEDRATGGRARSKNKLGKIDNDKMSDDSFYKFLSDVNNSIISVIIDGGPIYQCAPIGMNNLQYLMAWRDAGFHYSDGLIWLKNNHSISRKDYHPKHEVIHYGWAEGSHKWYGERNKFSVYECSRESVTEYQHPTQKPVKLPEQFIENSSQHGDNVMDLFGGSGSTLIACEKINRNCFAMELDPKYCDIIVARWEKFTGKESKLIS